MQKDRAGQDTSSEPIARATGPDQVPPWYVQAPALTLMQKLLSGQEM
jgi:hypothetical protein